MHDSLFQPLTMGALEARNRVFMAPLTRGRSTQPGSVPNEMMATYYRQRASAGLIISEATGISVEGLGWDLHGDARASLLKLTRVHAQAARGLRTCVCTP